MSKMTSSENNADMLPEYDFSKGVRGKHKYRIGQPYTITVEKLDGSIEKRLVTPQKGVIVLDDDVLQYFPDSQAVNKALRTLITLFPDQQPEPTE